ncbi:hypothetical protein Poli38472_002993 [Pythium oligandrum]|uniref:TBC1 domain family member 23 n=1 Tax=Pythium oligandrum TaxID=41045 RepID=A0A8K1C6A6_PYTOL|nr:hypothetical protein Poli38472_002993 [Pythium oligandrum]|eukprot:TMW57068.1 hypothetical protein Poli38472_002993 [Pythium oligandrum]
MPPLRTASPRAEFATNDGEKDGIFGSEPHKHGAIPSTLSEIQTSEAGTPVDYEESDTPREELQLQLEREMLKRRPDRFMIGVICRSLGGVPDRFRSSIWKELLGVARNERLHLDESISRVEEDLENQKVISADACRTRGHDAFFKQPQTIELVTKLLTFYCKSRNIRYKQGMNEVLAPFLMLEQNPPMPDSVVFQLFYALIDKFLPHVFIDREFKSLQCSFQLYRLLMRYHDPMLCNYLDQHAMTPELYVTPWFMTLFSRNLSRELVLQLWDFFILHEDPYLLHFVAYALVEVHRDAIFQSDVAMLPQVLSNITFETRERMDLVCQRALTLMETTPQSFKRDLYSVCYDGYSDAMVPFLRQLMGVSSLQVYSDELITNLMSRIGKAGASMPSPDDASAPQLLSRLLERSASFSSERFASRSSVYFIVLDCRPIEQYRECHLNLSYHIDPDVVASPDALSVLIKGFTRMKGCHFCFVGPSVPPSPPPRTSSVNPFDAISKLTRGGAGENKPEAAPTTPKEGLHYEHITVTRLVLMFLQKGFEHVSRVDGGFDELKKEIDSKDEFTKEQLLVFADKNASNTESSGFKLFARKAFERVRTMSDDDPTSAIVLPTSNEEGATEAPTPPASNPSNLAAKTKATVSTLSQKLQNFTSAAKDAVTKAPNGNEGQTHSIETEERRVVGEEEWMEVCVRTREALEKSMSYKDVVFQHGSLGILFNHSRQKKYQTIVDSLVPESQASESQQIEAGDLLVAVNGQDVSNISFADTIELVKDAQRPLMLRFHTPKKKNRVFDPADAISIPPLPPIMLSASHHSICVSWTKLQGSSTRYQLQYAKQSDYNFHPWTSVPMKQEQSAELDRSGITQCHNGTLVGLDPGVSLVFRVRCGLGDKWGPYSVSSNTMKTREKSLTDDADNVSMSETASTSSSSASPQHSPTHTAVFLPGECPEFAERGVFYFRVVIGLRARREPAFDAEKCDIILEKGTIVKCSERLIAPGTNQVFVRLCSDWNIAGGRKAPRSSLLSVGRPSVDASATSTDLDEDVDVWAFENTPEGAVVLERLPEFTETPAVPLQEQAKSLVSSILSASGIKSNPTSASGMATPPMQQQELTMSVPASSQPLGAPRITVVSAVSSTEIEVAWAPPSESEGVTRYQLQYSKNRFTAIWWSVKQDIDAETRLWRLTDLVPGTTYIFRLRGGRTDQWGPFSEGSEPCKTQDLERTASGSNLTSTSGRQSPPPLRTGSTFLDKAVAAASKLSRGRPKTPLNEASAVLLNPQEGDLVDVAAWKAELQASQPDAQIFTAIRYIPTVMTPEEEELELERKSEATPLPPRLNESVLENGEDATLERKRSHSAPLLTWNRVGERELVVTKTSLFALARPSSALTIDSTAVSERSTDALVETCRSLASLVRITSKKTIKNSVVFHFRRDAEDEADAQNQTEQLCFVVDDKETCVALVKQHYQQRDG